MKRISNVSGAMEVGGGGRIGSTGGGMVAIAPAMPRPMLALTKRPKSSAGHVVNWPAMRVSRDSTAGQRRSGRRNLLTIGARCCVMSPDCIQNVDNSQPQALWEAPPEQTTRGASTPAATRLRHTSPMGERLAPGVASYPHSVYSLGTSH